MAFLFHGTTYVYLLSIHIVIIRYSKSLIFYVFLQYFKVYSFIIFNIFNCYSFCSLTIHKKIATSLYYENILDIIVHMYYIVFFNSSIPIIRNPQIIS